MDTDVECCPLHTEELAHQSIRIHAENIGGIERTDVEASAGVTALTGRNATNRTSLLQAVMAALGSDTASLKGDAEQGRVELAIGDSKHYRRYKVILIQIHR